MHLNRDVRYHSGKDVTRKEAIKSMLNIDEEGTSARGKPGIRAGHIYKAALGLVVVNHTSAEQDTTFM